MKDDKKQLLLFLHKTQDWCEKTDRRAKGKKAHICDECIEARARVGRYKFEQYIDDAEIPV